MFTSIGGNLPSLDEVLVLENRVGAAWLRSWSAVLQGLVAFAQGTAPVAQSEEVEGVSAGQLVHEADWQLSNAEKVVIQEWRKVLHRLDQVSRPAVADEAPVALNDAFEGKF